MNLSPDQKIAGVLAPLFALRTESDLGIGDVDGLRQFIDWVSGIGFKLVQLLPINETGGDNSPYNAISAMAIDPTTLHLAPGSPDDLSREDFDAVTADVDLARLRRGHVRYRVVKPLKQRLLEKAFARFRQVNPGTKKRAKRFQAFCDSGRSTLPDYTLFRVLMEKNGNSEAWDQWRPEHASMAAAKNWLNKQTDEERAAIEERRTFYSYVQWIAYEQWTAVRKYAEVRGVALMGDIPFGVSYYSADVFALPDQFALEWSGGAPPEPYFKDDAFTQKWGQNWGIPLYRWDVMRERNFDWWRQRIRGVKEIFHVFRIDHVLGFYRIYAFPWRPQCNPEFLPLTRDEMRARTSGAEPQFAPRDDSSSKNCETNRREGEEYLRVVLEESKETRVVGEDLGTVPDYVRPSLQSLGIAGFKIPFWENDSNNRPISGAEYERLSVATFATHDHKPLCAVWEEAWKKSTNFTAQARFDLAKIAEFAGVSVPNENLNFEKDFYLSIFDALFRSESWIAIVMITDLLGRKERFNVPGTAAKSNWIRRLHSTVTRLAISPTVKRRMRLVRSLLEKSGRT